MRAVVKPINPNQSAVDIQIGMRFGKRVILRRGPGDKESRHFRWWMRCDCGKEDLVWATALRAGKAWACRSCAQHERNHTMVILDDVEMSLAMAAKKLDMTIADAADYFGINLEAQGKQRKPTKVKVEKPQGLLKNEIARRQGRQ